jgi:hypothetical protein
VSINNSSSSPTDSAPVPRAPPAATAGVSFEKEKVGIFWDYARSWLFAILGFLLSAFLAFIFNVDKLPSSYQVPSILAALAVVFLSLLGLSWRFQVTAKRVGTLIGRVEKGEPLGDLADLLDIRAFSLKGILKPLFRSTPLVEELFLESVTLQSAVALNDYTAVLHLRNTGSREARINAYSVDKSEWVYLSPSKVIAPSSDAILPVTRDLSHNIRLERGQDHQITLWTEKGWTFTFSFGL